MYFYRMNEENLKVYPFFFFLIFNFFGSFSPSVYFLFFFFFFGDLCFSMLEPFGFDSMDLFFSFAGFDFFLFFLGLCWRLWEVGTCCGGGTFRSLMLSIERSSGIWRSSVWFPPKSSNVSCYYLVCFDRIYDSWMPVLKSFRNYISWGILSKILIPRPLLNDVGLTSHIFFPPWYVLYRLYLCFIFFAEF